MKIYGRHGWVRNKFHNMKFYVVSKGLFADGGRRWTPSREAAHCFGENLEAAQCHAHTFRDPEAQRKLVSMGHIEIPGHKDARVIGFLDD